MHNKKLNIIDPDFASLLLESIAEGVFTLNEVFLWPYSKKIDEI